MLLRTLPPGVMEFQHITGGLDALAALASQREPVVVVATPVTGEAASASALTAMAEKKGRVNRKRESSSNSNEEQELSGQSSGNSIANEDEKVAQDRIK